MTMTEEIDRGTESSDVRNGASLMAIAGVAFIGYGVVFLIRNFSGDGFELGVGTLNGLTRDDLDVIEPGIVDYISHLHVATAGFIVATGIAVTGLAWYGVRRGHFWAWITGVASPVAGLGIALPMHYMDRFGHDWVTHLGPIYLATLVFVVGALWALRGLRTAATPGAWPTSRT